MHKMMILAALATALSLAASAAPAQDKGTAKKAAAAKAAATRNVVIAGKGVSMTTPHGYDEPANSKRLYPIVVNGCWGEGWLFSQDVRAKYPAFFLDYQRKSEAEGAALADILDKAVAQGLRIDPDRVYLTGFSAGGSGSYKLVRGFLKKGKRFAAILRVAGQSETVMPDDAVAATSVWLHIGTKDTPMRVQITREAYENLRKHALNKDAAETTETDTDVIGFKRVTKTLTKDDVEIVKYSVCEGMGHTAEPVYKDPNVFKWMFAQSLKTRKAPPVTPVKEATKTDSAKPGASKSLMIWDGDTASRGSGWVAPKTDTNAFGPSDTAHKGKKSLEFRGVGAGWIGCAWNWFGWYPASSRSDLSGYDAMRFYIRVTGDSKPDDLSLLLASNAEGAPTTAALSIRKYMTDKAPATLTDGEWHEVVIPMKDFVADTKKPGFDIKSVWEFHISEWSSGARDFTVNLDSVRFESPSSAAKPASVEPAAAKPAPATAKAASTVAEGSDSLMIWDGGTAARGSGWVAPKTDTNAFGPSDTAHKGKKSLEFRGSGAGWIGVAWNWFGWYPANSSSDLSGYESMRFYIRVTGDAKPDDLSLLLASNVEGAPTTAALSIRKYMTDKAPATLTDGEWHEVVIPMKDFVADTKKPGFDIKSVWEFHISEWSSGARDFTVNLDSVRFSKPAD